MKERNVLFAICKFIFCICIIIMHCVVPFKGSYIFEGAYIFVDFFFIFQGYYIFDKIVSHESPLRETLAYVKKRIVRFFPCTLIVALAYVAVDIYINRCSTYLTFLRFVARISFLGMVFPRLALSAQHLWFLSASIVSGGACVFLLCFLKRKIFIYIPILVCLIDYYLISAYGNMDVWWELVFGVLCIGLVRAFGDILLGMLCKYIRNKIKNKRISIHKRRILLITFIIMVLACVYGIVIYPHTRYDCVFILIFGMMIVVGDFCNYFSKNIFLNLIDRLTMPMYIFQMIFIELFRNKFSGNIVVYVLACDIICSIMWVMVENNRNNLRMKI